MSNMNMSQFKEIWDPSVNRLGRMTIFPVILASFLPNVYLYVVYGFIPPIEIMVETWLNILVIFAAFYIVEPMSYYPILGLAGTYLSFLSGNIGNMRVPCSAVAQEVVGVEPETPEAEIISTLGITGSIVTNLVAVSIAAIAGAKLLEIFPAPIMKAFQTFAAPAIFGAVFGQFAVQSFRTAAIALAIPLGILAVGYSTGTADIMLKKYGWAVMLATIVGTIAINKFLYDKEKKAA